MEIDDMGALENYQKIKAWGRRGKELLNRKSRIITKSNPALCALETKCKESGLKIVETYGHTASVHFLATKHSITDGDARFVKFLKSSLQSMDAILFSHYYRGVILAGYENLDHPVSELSEEITKYGISVVANDMKSEALIDICQAPADLSELWRKEDTDFTRIEAVSKKILAQNYFREKNFVHSDLGILKYIPKADNIYQMLDILHISSPTIREELKKKEIGYSVIVPDIDKR